MKTYILASALLATFGAAHAQNVITNGSFEDRSSAVAPGELGRFTSFKGWSSSNDVIVHDADGAGTAFDGFDFVTLSPSSVLTQSNIATTAGQSYTLSYAVSGAAGTGATNNVLNFSWDGTVTRVPGIDATSASGNVWTTYTFNVQGTGSDTLAFLGASTGNGARLDNVMLTAAVPEPSTYALMLAGLGFAGVVIRRRNSAR